jgi:hypothetical protein
LAKLAVGRVDQVFGNPACGKIVERVVLEAPKSLRREVFEPILGRPVVEHALGDRHDIAGVDHPSAAEHPALQDTDGEIVGGSPSPVHVELIVHRAVTLRQLRPNEIATLLEDDDFLPGLRQQTCRRCAPGTGSDDADLSRDGFRRRLFRQVRDRAGHGVTLRGRFIEGPG